MLHPQQITIGAFIHFLVIQINPHSHHTAGCKQSLISKTRRIEIIDIPVESYSISRIVPIIRIFGTEILHRTVSRINQHIFESLLIRFLPSRIITHQFRSIYQQINLSIIQWPRSTGTGIRIIRISIQILHSFTGIGFIIG